MLSYPLSCFDKLYCSHTGSEEAYWTVLPDHLVCVIFSKAGEDRWPPGSMLRLRRVCKAWRDAFAHFAGPLFTRCPSAFVLDKVWTAMPNLCHLSVKTDAANVHLPAYTTLSRLSKLDLRPTRTLHQAIESAEGVSAFPSQEDLDALQHLPLLQVSH